MKFKQISEIGKSGIDLFKYYKFTGSQAGSLNSKEHQEGIRILFVDDFPEGTLLLQKYFRSNGCRVSLTSMAPDALFEVAKKYYDLVILDWNLAFCNGDEFLNAAQKVADESPLYRMNEMSHNKATPVIFYSSHPMYDLKIRKMKDFVLIDRWEKQLTYQELKEKALMVIKKIKQSKRGGE